MGHPRFPGNGISRLGRELYESKIRSVVETEENIGKLLSIDVETAEYEMGYGMLETAGRLHERHSDAAIYTLRIGYDAVVSVRGEIHRAVPCMGDIEDFTKHNHSYASMLEQKAYTLLPVTPQQIEE